MAMQESNYDKAHKYRFTLPLPFAPSIASQAKKATFLSEASPHTFAHIMVQKSPTELKHLQRVDNHSGKVPLITPAFW